MNKEKSQRKVTPCNKCNLSKDGERFIDTVRRVAGEYKVSERTARRYLKRGELPDGRRGIGRDAKTYPASTRLGYLSPLHGPLSIARSNVRRAARAGSFYEGDLNLLRDIVVEARRLLLEWEEMTRADKSQLTQTRTARKGA